MSQWVHFIGEDGYYPAWAKGRWVLQRVYTPVRGILTQTIDELSRPWVSYESVVWAPGYGAIGRAVPILRSLYEADKALEEVQRIRFACPRCGRSGTPPGIVTGEVSGLRSGGPEHWMLRCANCGRMPEGRVVPDRHVLHPHIANMDAALIATRWLEKGRPELDHPAASKTTVRTGPIVDFNEWMERYEPTLNELAYVGQQLWPNLADFLWDMDMARIANQLD